MLPVVGAADERAPVGAGVMEHHQLAVTIPREEQSPFGNHPAHVVAGVGNFRFMAEVEPALVED